MESNLERIRTRIDEAARRSGRRGEEIRLLAVTKRVDVEQIRQAISLGLRLFGENYVQEAQRKAAELAGAGVELHLIGHLQSNKVRSALELFSVIQSVDSVELARKIAQTAADGGRTARILLQVNISQELTKHGVDAGSALDFMERTAGLPGLQVCGLMTIPPPAERPGENRSFFKQVAVLADELEERHFPHWRREILSMGMSDDYEVAIEEGANLVRIGTAIFGPRPGLHTR